MSTHTRTPARVQYCQRLRPAPLALGIFLATVTASVLFDDVRHGAEITTSHALALAALVAALASGHMAWPQLRAWRIAPGLALALLFAASTLYVVVSSGTRNAETAATKQAAAADAQRQRDDITRMRREAETILTTCLPGTPREHVGIRCGLRDAMTAECGSGKGSRCTGRTYSVTTYEAAIAGYEAQLARLGPPPAPSGYAHAARVFAALPGITAAPDDIAQRLALLLPFLAVLICELGTLVFLHLGLGHATVADPAGIAVRQSSGDSDQTSYPATVAGEIDPRWFAPLADQPEPPTTPPGPKGGNRVRTSLPANVLQFRQSSHPVIAALDRAGGSVASNRDLAELMGVTPGESTKRVREVAHLLVCERVGKELRIALRPSAAQRIA